MQDQTKADKDAALDNMICKIKLKLIRIQKKKTTKMNCGEELGLEEKTCFRKF